MSDWEQCQPVRVKGIDLYGANHRKGHVVSCEQRGDDRAVVWVRFPGCCESNLGRESHKLGFYENEIEAL